MGPTSSLLSHLGPVPHMQSLPLQNNPSPIVGPKLRNFTHGMMAPLPPVRIVGPYSGGQDLIKFPSFTEGIEKRLPPLLGFPTFHLPIVRPFLSPLVPTSLAFYPKEPSSSPLPPQGSHWLPLSSVRRAFSSTYSHCEIWGCCPLCLYFP